ncbi:MAG TPA: tetratricopeptide repeat protein [Kineosporiaceae bacterium]
MGSGREGLNRAAEAVLRSAQDAEPALARARRSVVTAPDQLPALSGHFIGRQDHLARLLEPPSDPDRPAVSVIDGMPGIGKSALAVLAARRLTESGRYPDGTLFLDLHGYSGSGPTLPADALAVLLHGLRVPDAEIPSDLAARIGLYRSVTAPRRVLIVLDNAHDEAQVRPLLPGAAGCAVLVTSRSRLAGLDDADHLTLDALPPAEAAQLFHAVAGPGRYVGDPDTVDRIVHRCGCLPLAVRIAAARLRTSARWTGPDLLERLASATTGLAELDDGERSVSAAFAMSFQQLDRGQHEALVLLSLHPGTDYERFATAALLGTTPEDAGQVLAGLERVNLVDEPETGRYRFHDLIRGFARAAAEDCPDPDRQRALDRLCDLYGHLTGAAVALAHPHQSGEASAGGRYAAPIPPFADPAGARSWLDAERANLIAVAQYAAEHHRLGHALRQSHALHQHLRTQGHYTVGAQLHQRALDAAREAGDLRAQIRILNDLADIRYLRDEYDVALELHTQALDRARAVGEQAGEADARNGIGHNQLMLGRHGEAAQAHGHALQVAREAGHRLGEMQALTGLGRVDYVQGSLVPAQEHLTQALAIAREIGHRAGEVGILVNLGHIHFVRGEPEPAGRYYAEVLTTARASGDQVGALNALNGLGWVSAAQGGYEPAHGYHAQALDLARAIGHRLGELISLAGLGDVQLAEARHPRAVEYFAQVRDLAEQTGNRNYAYEAHLGLGRAYHGGGHPDLAMAAHEQALALAVALGQPADQVRAHDGIAAAARALGDPDTARRHWQTALELLGSLRVPAADDVTAAGVRAQLAALDDPSAAHPPAAGLPAAHPPATGLPAAGQPTEPPDGRIEPADGGADGGTDGGTEPAAGGTGPRDGARVPATVSCVRHGNGWRLDDGERTVIVGHSVGMLHLAVLLANPDEDIPCVDLAAGVAAVHRAAADRSTHRILDDAAVRQYRRRIEELGEEVDALERRGRTAQAHQRRTELDWLVGELAAATGINGRHRGFTGNNERARLAVTRAIHRAIARIHRANPQIGEHLQQSIRTGVRCCYRPYPRMPLGNGPAVARSQGRR